MKETIALIFLGAGILEIPCRIVNGFFADRKWISATAQYSLCLFGAGFLSMLCTVFPGVPGKITNTLKAVYKACLYK